MLVLHHTGVVPLVGGDHRLHDDGPHVVAHLEVQTSHRDFKRKLLGGAMASRTITAQVRSHFSGELLKQSNYTWAERMKSP